MRFSRLCYYLKVALIPISVAFAFGFSGLTASAAGTAIVSVLAPAQPVSPGAQFTINIMVQPSNAIVGAQFYLSFNPSLVTVNSVTEGNLLKQNGANSYFNPGQIDNDAGTINGVWGSIVSPGQTVSTEGTFAIITMTAGSTKGTCPLTLSKVIFGDVNAQSVPVSTVNGQISIHQSPVLNAIGQKAVKVGSLLTFTISATDPDGEPLTYSASGLPSGASFTPSTQTFSWTPTAGQAGTYRAVQFEVTDGTLTDSEKITITVSLPSPSGGGGGRRGGGGSATGSTPPITTNENSIISNDGVFNQTAEVKSEDGTAKVVIGQGAKGLTQDGAAISGIGIITTQPPAAPPKQSNFVGMVYNIGPDGATFDRPIELTLTYNPALIPEGFDESNLVVATWNTASGRWSDLESSVDLKNNTVTAKVNHFSIYCVLAHARPAAFVISDLTVPAEVKINDSVNANALITNVGDLEGIWEGTLKMDGQDVGTQRVSLSGGGNQRISFKVTPDRSGTYVLSIGNLSANLAVKEPSNGTLAISEPPLSASEVKAGDDKSLPATTISSPPAVPVFSLALLVEIIGGAFLLTAATTFIILLRRRL